MQNKTFNNVCRTILQRTRPTTAHNVPRTPGVHREQTATSLSRLHSGKHRCTEASGWKSGVGPFLETITSVWPARSGTSPAELRNTSVHFPWRRALRSSKSAHPPAAWKCQLHQRTGTQPEWYGAPRRERRTGHSGLHFAPDYSPYLSPSFEETAAGSLKCWPKAGKGAGKHHPRWRAGSWSG